MNKKSYVNSCLNRLYKLLILFIGTIVFFIVLVGGCGRTFYLLYGYRV